MVGPLDSVSSLLQSAVLHSQLQSAQREAEISDARRRQAAKAAKREELKRTGAVDPVQGKVIEEHQPGSAPLPPLPERRRGAAEARADPGRIDVLV
ncbi:hypothetical protein IT575_05745 [bacterium]|nr:hypothetical protein [bacterium]